MKLGQTSFVWYLSNVGASLIAFLATLYFARELGAAAIGIYSVVVAVAAWATLPTTMGVGGAITKRVSEGTERGRFMAAGGVLLGTLALLVGVVLFFLRPYLDSYVGFPATDYLVAMVLTSTAATYVHACLKGKHLVHVSGALSPVELGSRSILQIGFVFTGLGVAGILLGHVLAAVLIVLLGLYVLPGTFDRPRVRHFESLVSFAQFAWLSTVRSKVFNWIDVIVLGAFVSSNLIGIYSVSWTLASFLGLFSSAVRSSVFPEVSEVSEKNDVEAVRDLVESSVSYTGLFLIPGFVGSVVLGDRILRIYGDEFTVGTTVLVLLVFGYLVHSYGKQLVNILNGIDHPELAFRVSLVYIVFNFGLNVVLVYLFGWTGAAVATLVSAASGLFLSFFYVRRHLHFQIPIGFLSEQWLSALVMALCVYSIRTVEETYRVVGHNFATVLILVGLGAGLYFGVLFAISTQFRTTIRNNAPLETPLLG